MRSRRRPGRGRSSTPGTPPRPRAALAIGVALALVASALSVPTAFADPAPRGWPGVTRSESVPGTGVEVRPRPPDPVVESAVTAPKAARDVARPKAGAAEVEVAAEPARAADLPVRVGVAGAKSPRRVRVEVLDRPVAERAGVGGVLFRVQRADGAADAGPVTVDVDYSSFRDEFGGDYASRLSLVRLPACAAWAPERAECVTGTPVPARNDVRGSRIRGEVTASGTPGVPDDEKQRRRVTAPDVLYAVTAASGGSAGNFKPTSLSPSATWEVGLQSGDFSWAYPLDLPPVPGPEPDVALAYSSGGIDGRTAASNNQASWIGEGFDFQPGFIERQYTSCAADAAGGNNATPTGDLCYASANAVVALPGVAGELVHDAGRGVWRAEQDDGWKVDQLFGADNGDNDGEHWRMTAPDGTQYFFGLRAAARSAWTVPVFGNQPGEPCHASSFAASWCQQAYRWMLDRVVDRHGDTIAYYYDTDTNHYGRNNTASLATPFVRSGQLARIDYGLRDGQAEPAARVVFTAADRCLPGSACTRSQPADWPDVPWDQQCDGGTCAGKHSPVFFGAKRLAKITSQVRRDGQLADVDSWALNHLFPATHDATSPVLWLESITHTGHVGGTAVTPDVNEEITYDGDGGPEVEREITEPEVIGPNAVRRRASGDLGAYVTEVKKTRVRTALAGGGFRETEEQHFYDDLGAHVRTSDLGDLAVADDDTCTRVEYARNLDAWLIATPKRVVKVSVNCSVADYAPGDVISDERTYYDGSDDLDAPPAKGDPTREEELSGWDGDDPRYTTVERSVYDAHGREVEEYDALGDKETTAYTPAVGSPVTSVTTTNALGHTESTAFQVATGDAVEQVD
ncbi:SpvB/TcaC N-terminal domain-containing protein [Actinosynnema sp. NPDC002837]